MRHEGGELPPLLGILDDEAGLAAQADNRWGAFVRAVAQHGGFADRPACHDARVGMTEDDEFARRRAYADFQDVGGFAVVVAGRRGHLQIPLTSNMSSRPSPKPGARSAGWRTDAPSGAP